MWRLRSWPEQRVAPPLREFVVPHQDRCAGREERPGGTVIVGRSARDEAPEPLCDCPRCVAGKQHQDTRRRSLVPEPFGHEMLRSDLGSGFGWVDRRGRTGCSSICRRGQDRERCLESEVEHGDRRLIGVEQRQALVTGVDMNALGKSGQILPAVDDREHDDRRETQRRGVAAVDPAEALPDIVRALGPCGEQERAVHRDDHRERHGDAGGPWNGARGNEHTESAGECPGDERQKPAAAAHGEPIDLACRALGFVGPEANEHTESE